MKFGRAHRILTTVLAAFGILAVLGAVRLPGVAPLQLALEALVAAQVIVLVTRRDASSDGLVFGLALAHFLAATLFGGGLVFLVAFAGAALVLPGALVLSHLRRAVEANYQQGARDRTGSPVDVPRILRSRRVMERGPFAMLGSVALPLVALTALLFVTMPRFDLPSRGSWLGRSGMVGFSDAVDLSQRGADPNEEVALRFRVSDAPSPAPASIPLRLRGAVLDDFDGVRWSRGAAAKPDTPASTAALTREITIEREPFEPSATFLPVGTTSLRVLDEKDEKNGIPRRYVVSVAKGANADAETSLGDAERARDLAMPRRLSSQILALAHAWADAAPTPAAKARAIEQHLNTELAYDLHSPSRGAAEPLDHFLFQSKRGHCELFASSMVVMLRALGIPAREVTGFVGGRYNRFGKFYVVRQGDAHAWVEAYVMTSSAGGHWLTLDPTPPSSTPPDTGISASARDLGDAFAMRFGDAVTHYDRSTQASIVQWLRLPTAICGALVVAGLVAFGLQRTRRDDRARGGTRRSKRDHDASDDEATALYVTLEQALMRHGIVRDRAVPPLAHAEDLVRQQHPLATEVATLTQLYLEARFGGRALTGDAREDFVRGVGRVLAWQRA